MPRQIDTPACRRALRHAIANRMLWHGGNAITTGTPVVYLARDLGARGTTLSMIVAARAGRVAATPGPIAPRSTSADPR